jgi:sporulation protein YlmC with PRC-barrel domain
MVEGSSTRAELLRARDFVGSDVVDANGEPVGSVADLLLDRRGTIRFLAVNPGVLRNQVLVPTEAVDWSNEQALIVHRWTREQIRQLPGYDPKQPVTRALLDEMALAHPRFYGGQQVASEVAAPGEPRILPLKEAKAFKLSKNAPDLRGWNVFGEDGERVGKVSDLLVDPEHSKVCYLDVDLADDLFLLKEDRHVLIPTEHVELRERGKDVWIQRLAAAEVAQLPAYTGGAVDAVMQERVRVIFLEEPA